MTLDKDLLITIALTGFAVSVLAIFLIYRLRIRKRQEEACFDAMLHMLLQPTPANIATLEKLLSQSYLSHKTRNELLFQAEIEADCLSLMPTGELRSSQPFLQQRYSQILATAELN